MVQQNWQDLLQKSLGRKNGVIAAEYYMILENIPKNFKEKFRMIQVKEWITQLQVRKSAMKREVTILF